MFKAQVYTQYTNRYTAYLRHWKLEFHGGRQLGKEHLKRFLGDNNDNKVTTQGSRQTEVVATPHRAPIFRLFHPERPPHYSKCPSWKSPSSSATSSRKPSPIPLAGNQLSLLMGQNGQSSRLSTFCGALSVFVFDLWQIINR